MKIKSQLYDEASGSIGGLTASNGKGGLYFKNKPNPSNPNTAKQQVVRNALAGANTAWTGMTTGNRAKWEAWASTLTSKNSIGTDITVSGWASFAGAFVLLTQASIATNPLLTSAPATAGYASSADITLKNTANKVAVSTSSETSRAVSIFTSTAQKQTINNYGGGYNFNKRAALVKDTDIATTQATVAGKRYYAKVQVIETDGRYSKPSTIQLDT